jgi:hypothetical protein
MDIIKGQAEITGELLGIITLIYKKRVRADKLGIKRSFACQPGQKIIIKKEPGLTS